VQTARTANVSLTEPRDRWLRITHHISIAYCGAQHLQPYEGSKSVLPLRKEKVMTHQEFQSCIQACIECGQECEHCADACLSERDVAKMAQCIRLDRDCADACWLAATFMSRGSQFAHELCRLCAQVCEACSAECRKHQMEHCQRCADACQRCAEECRRMSHVAA
jgi:hypothetical protein